MKVAAIILNYNSLDDSRKCISYLKRQEGVELEIILVDNCSCDAVAAELFCQEQGCTFLASKENRGYNAGNNIGLRYAVEKGYKYAMIANPDMEFPQIDYIARLIAVMEKDADIVAVGSDIISPTGIHQNPLKRHSKWYDSFNWTKDIFWGKKRERYNIDNYKTNKYCRKLSGCCLLVDVQFIKSIGFFDTHVFLYCEESILAEQIHMAQKHMYYLADVQAVHRHIDSAKGDPIKRILQWRASRLYFINYYSRDSIIGKKIARISIYIYTSLVILYKRLIHKNV